MKGKFITFEGTEGCGKSTQSRLLYRHLKTKGYPVIYLREPGGVALSEKIRKILLDPKSDISPISETLLYMAARSEVVNRVIKPALLKGKVVICDRFLDSTVAYQGYGLGIDVRFIKNLGRVVNNGINPGLTILLDTPLKKGLEHRRFKEDRIERRSYAYHRRVRNGYLKIAKNSRGRIKIVKLCESLDKTQENIRLLVEKFLKV